MTHKPDCKANINFFGIDANQCTCKFTPQTDNNLTWEDELEVWTEYADLTEIQKNNVKAFIKDLLSRRDKQLAERIINEIPERTDCHLAHNEYPKKISHRLWIDQLRNKYL